MRSNCSLTATFLRLKGSRRDRFGKIADGKLIDANFCAMEICYLPVNAVNVRANDLEVSLVFSELSIFSY